MVSTILAVLTEPSTVRAVLDAAACAAAVNGACRIDALHVRLDPQSLIMPTEEVMTRKRRAELEAALAERAHGVQLAFREWSQAADGLASRVGWDEITGAVEAEVTARGKLADLLVLARHDGAEGRDALHAALFTVRRLFLLVPPGGGGSLGRHMAIAWKTSEMAEHAVVAALPWLEGATRISVLIAATDVDLEAQNLLALLVGHGVPPNGVSVGGIAIEAIACGPDEDIGKALLARAGALGADSLVMGAYRRHRFFEWVLGGVTRHVLHHADIPAFMLH